MSDDGDYAAWQAHREMDRMPDPSLNPCEHVERENERLRIRVDDLTRGLREIRNVHTRADASENYYERCVKCNHRWPCATVEAIDSVLASTETSEGPQTKLLRRPIGDIVDDADCPEIELGPAGSTSG